MKLETPGQRHEPSLRLHLRRRILSGIALLVPVGISWFVLSILYSATVGVVSRGMRVVLPNLPDWAISLTSAIGFVLLLYIAGTLAANVFGKRLIGYVERVIGKVPLLDSVYGTSKQIVEMFKEEPDVARRKAVLVPFPHRETRVLGFVTGRLTFPDGSPAATVFVPSTPNPTTGFLQFFPPADITELDWSTDEAIQFIMSGGLIQPHREKASNQD